MKPISVKSGCAILATASLVAMQPAQADDGTRAFSIGGFVPIVCRAQFRGVPTMIGQDTIALGQLEELCNVEEGYRIILRHAPAIKGTLHVGNEDIALSPSGETVIVESDVARFRSNAVGLTVSEGAFPTRLSLRIEQSSQAI